jgi:uncharacterized membrane protein
MQRQRFEAPTASKLPLALAALLVLAVAGGVWWWRSATPAPSAQIAAGELITDDDSPSAAREPSDQAPAEPARSAMEAIGSAGMALGADPQGGATLESLLEQADEAFDIGELYQALPLYKEAAVRLQGQINAAAVGSPEREALAARLDNVRELVRESEEGIREMGGGPEVPDLANRTPHAPPEPGETRDLTIQELGNFPYDDEAGGVPPDVAALDGVAIRMSGYMVPGYQTDSIKQFTLVTSVYECCFGQPPGVEHAINVVLPEGRAVTFTYGEVQVTGTLRVEEEWRDGFVVNLFTIQDVTSVKATGNQ